MGAISLAANGVTFIGNKASTGAGIGCGSLNTENLSGTVTVNGGTVSADSRWTVGISAASVSLGWRRSADSITAALCEGSVTIQTGKGFVSQASEEYFSGTLSAARLKDMAGKTLTPAADTVHAVGVSSMTHGAVTPDMVSAHLYERVMLTVAPESGYSLEDNSLIVSYTDGSGASQTAAVTAGAEPGAYSFTMPSSDVTVLVSFVSECFIPGSEAYYIHTADDWNAFCDCLEDHDNYSSFAGKTVYLEADISVTRMAGSGIDDYFSGTFDGQGHTLHVTLTGAGDYCAPFRYLKNEKTYTKIMNLNVTGTVTTAYRYGSGLVGGCGDTSYVYIQNCSSAVVITGTGSGDGMHGGFVGINNCSGNAVLAFSGSSFTGKLLTTGGTTRCGGFVGGKTTYGRTALDNCLYAPAALEPGETEISDNNSHTFIVDNGNGYFGMGNCYYTRVLHDTTKSEQQVYPIVPGDGVSVVVLTPESTMLRAKNLMMSAKGVDEKQAGFVLPQFLTLIGESAFEGITAESVEVTENVAAIEARAFADCKGLKEIAIPETVLKIDDHAFDGCTGVTVYGAKGSEAERIAKLYNFTFVDPAETSPVTPEESPAVLPFVPAD